jgi:hypothetical protein
MRELTPAKKITKGLSLVAWDLPCFPRLLASRRSKTSFRNTLKTLRRLRS